MTVNRLQFSFCREAKIVKVGEPGVLGDERRYAAAKPP